MCIGVDEVCDSAYSNCQWCNQTDSTNNDIGFCDLGKYCISTSKNKQRNENSTLYLGCASALNCASGQACDNHECVSASYNSLKTIHFTTLSCEDSIALIFIYYFL